ncbi:AlpA family transcriptional regulator [Saccharospirillum alexandrii]|uniref:AlpA family transcriptional regulator n=1 Tax=Saccharospirillum alexandrii TaxID=2448477 RepID=UPI003736AA2F
MRILRLKDVMEQTGLARSTVYKSIDAGTFPKPVPLGGRSVGWIDSEIIGWIEDKVKIRDEKALQPIAFHTEE